MNLQKEKQNGSKSTDHNREMWPFDLVKVNHCFPKGLLSWLTSAKNILHSNYGGVNSKVCFGRKTKFLQESEDFAGNWETLWNFEIFGEILSKYRDDIPDFLENCHLHTVLLKQYMLELSHPPCNFWFEQLLKSTKNCFASIEMHTTSGCSSEQLLIHWTCMHVSLNSRVKNMLAT